MWVKLPAVAGPRRAPSFRGDEARTRRPPPGASAPGRGAFDPGSTPQTRQVRVRPEVHPSSAVSTPPLLGKHSRNVLNVAPSEGVGQRFKFRFRHPFQGFFDRPIKPCGR